MLRERLRGKLGEETWTDTDACTKGARQVVSPHVFVVLDCANPAAGGARHSLANINQVVIGRGPRRSAARTFIDGARTLEIELPDRRASTRHVRLTREGDDLWVDDLGSRNGTRLNGRLAASRVPLRDGDVVGVGHTLLLYRGAVSTPLEAPADLDLGTEKPAAPISTLDATLSASAARLALVARSTVPILVLGETGTGKELVGRSVHALSGRRGEFVPVNCGGLAPTLVESILFGHKRGAFSGAVADHAGLLRVASAGTLLLDEIGEMPLPVQAALLRALEDGEVLPLGATQPSRADVRFVAATHRDLEECVAGGTFREDLLARLSGFTFRLPPLRERLQDLGLMIASLSQRICPKGSPSLSPGAGVALLRHSWPRNVRELEKCLSHALALAEGGPIEVDHLPDTVRHGPSQRVLPASEHADCDRLSALLTETRGNVSATATAMRTSRSQVHRWMKRFGLKPDRFRR
jgi:hypothetical protein